MTLSLIDMSVMKFRSPPSGSGGGSETDYEVFGNWKIPVNATWVLDFAAWDERYVYTGSRYTIRKLFWEIFKHDLVYEIDSPHPLTGWGDGWKISPVSELFLLGFGPLLEGEERHKAIKAARATKEKGPEAVPDIGFVIRQRIANEYSRLGIEAPVTGFSDYQEPQEDDVWEGNLAPGWVKCKTFCRFATSHQFGHPKAVN